MLSDTDINARIVSHGLLKNHDLTKLHNSAYSLRVGSVFLPKTGFHELEPQVSGRGKRDYWILGPSECLIIQTKEELCLDNSLSAYYAPLNRLAQKGVMLLNASVVEPGYSGPLSCFLVNFSAQDVEISKDQEIAKITFHRLDSPVTSFQPSTIDSVKYGVELSKSARGFHETFLDMSGVESRAKVAATESARSQIFWSGIMIGLLLLFSQLEPFLSKYVSEKVISQNEKEENLKVELSNARHELEQIRIEIQKDKELMSLRDRVYELEKKQKPTKSSK
jgi:deoxycytidine triphosphate deaminase